MSYDKIPKELQLYNQWILWKGVQKENGKISKVPYQLNGQLADKTNPNHWASFEDVTEYKKKLNGSSGYDGIGFCLSDFDPFGMVDLDYTDNPEEFARQLRIYENFNSYSELSPSGKGLRIVCYGQIPSGRRRANVEIYSNKAFLTITGNVYNPAPIAHRQELLDILWAEMGPEVPAYNLGNPINQPEILGDQEILKRACNAANGEKFMQLFHGNWSAAGYPSQSEADFALIDMFAFYSQNIEQIKRLWAMSALSKRNKQTTIKGVPYLDHMIARAFDRQLPYVDLSQITVNGVGINESNEGVSAGNTLTPSHGTGEPQAQAMPGSGADGGEANTLSSAAAAKLVGEAIAVKAIVNAKDWPPGLLGEITQFILQQAPRPCYEIALVGAIGFMAGVCGRAYSTGIGGLNYYIAAIADTGCGKEQIKSGYDHIFDQLAPFVPSVESFDGPGEFRSGQSFVTYLQESQCFVSVLGEFGQLCQDINANKVDVNSRSIKKAMLDLYGKSGKGRKLGKSVYSDKTKNTKRVPSPAVTLVGESTPSEFFPSLDESAIASGFINRFSIIEYKGLRPRKNPTINTKVPEFLLNKLKDLMAHCLSYNELNSPTEVTFSNEALKYANVIEEKSTAYIDNKSMDIRKSLWARADMKFEKLSSILAVGLNPWFPVVDEICAKWAYNFIESEVENLAKRFDKGQIGEESKLTFASDDNQLEEMTRVIGRWIKKEEIPKYGMNDKMLGLGIYTFSALHMRLNQISCFKKDKMGSTYAFKRAIQSLLDSGDIQELNSEQIRVEFGKKAKCFKIVDYERFLNARV